MDRKSKAIVVAVAVVVIGSGIALAVGLGADERDDVASPSRSSSPLPTEGPAPDDTAGASPEESVEPSPDETLPPTGELPVDQASPAPGQSSTPVTVTRAGQEGSTIQVSAFVAGVTEDGGTCTLELTGPSPASASSDAFADATTTICSPLTVETGSLSPGAYTATVSYSSGASRGTSQPVDLEVTR